MRGPGEPSAERVHELLRGRGWSLATAESLTGGRLAALVTAVPGASATYLGGVVSYATELKVGVLGVPASLVAEHGVVSAACARAMAQGVRRLTGADCAVATTGVAGPTRQEGHDPGTVFLGLALPGDASLPPSVPSVSSVSLSLTGDRGSIVEQTCREALSALTRLLLRTEESGVG